MNKKFRVEFNNTGFYSGAGIWETLDEIAEIEAEGVQEAIEYAKDWWVKTSDDVEAAEIEVNEYAWRSAEIKHDKDGYLENYKWEFEV